MRNSCKRALRVYMSRRLKRERRSAGLTQSQFADKLLMDFRSYAALEKGKNLCSTVTFAVYLTLLCKDPDVLIEELRQALVKACQEATDD